MSASSARCHVVDFDIHIYNQYLIYDIIMLNKILETFFSSAILSEYKVKQSTEGNVTCLCKKKRTFYVVVAKEFETNRDDHRRRS